jgi:hypothetical protein
MTNTQTLDRPDIVAALTEFGKDISQENEPYINEIISVSSWDGILHGCSLYFVVPEIAYEYKAIEIEVKNVSTCVVKFITLATGQVASYPISINNGSAELVSNLNTIKSLQLFKVAITSLVDRVELKKSFRADVSNRIIPGEARIAVLLDGSRINAGWIKVEDGKVTFYTGKALRELWRPGLTQEQQRIADDIKRWPMDKLMANGYMEIRPISDFREII